MGIWLNHFCSLSLVVYIIGSGHVNDLLGGNKTLRPPEAYQLDGSFRSGTNTTSLGKSLPIRGQRPGRKNSVGQRSCVRDLGEPYSNRGFRLWSIYTAWRGMGSVRLNSALETP